MFCANVANFKSLLTSHSSIELKGSDKIIFKGSEFPLEIARGELSDGSVYYDITISSNDKDLNVYSELLRDMRVICSRMSGRSIITLQDGIGEHYCNLGYPIIYKTENLMRKLIAKFMAISIGYDWGDSSTPKEVLDSVRTGSKKEKANFLQEVDFIQLSNFLFKRYTKADSARFMESLRDKGDEETVKVGDLKLYTPFTNWEKYFSPRVDCSSEYLQTKWDRLYDYRCKIAHCRAISKSEFDDLASISKEVCEKIQSALSSIEDVHIGDEDRDELAENLSGEASKGAAEFIAKYNNMASLLKSACELSSSEDDVFSKYDTNKSNIKMQARYLLKNKGMINREIAEKVDKAQQFRNIIVHHMGLIEISEAELTEEIASIDSVIDFISALDTNDLANLKGVDKRDTRENEE